MKHCRYFLQRQDEWRWIFTVSTDPQSFRSSKYVLASGIIDLTSRATQGPSANSKTICFGRNKTRVRVMHMLINYGSVVNVFLQCIPALHLYRLRKILHSWGVQEISILLQLWSYCLRRALHKYQQICLRIIIWYLKNAAYFVLFVYLCFILFVFYLI